MYSTASCSVPARTRFTVLALVAQILFLQCHLDYCFASYSTDGSNSNKNNMDQFLNKKYELNSSENFDEIMKALGVSFLTRKIGAAASPIMELTKEGDEYLLTSKSTFKNTETRFKLGEEFDEETPDGRQVKSIFTEEGNKLIQIQKGDKVTKIVREFSPEEVKMVLTVDDITCTRIYKPL